MTALLQVANTTPVTITPDDTGVTVPMGTAIRRLVSPCQVITTDGTDVRINGKGYYIVDLTANITPSGTTATTLQVYADGVAVPGAIATTPAAAANSNLTIATTVRVCGCDAMRLSLKATGGAFNLSSISTRVVAA